MAAGGSRKNAGRKKGSQTKRTQELVAALANSGETPIEYMLRVMRSPSEDDKRRDAMAVAAAPFIHPRLAAVEHKGDAENPVAFQIVSGVPRQEEDRPLKNGHAGAH